MSTRRAYSSTRTEDSYGEYSDDFSDDDLSPARSAPDEGSKPARARGRGQQGRRRGRGQGRHSQARSDIQMDAVTKRLLSANILRRNELQNEVEEMKKKLRTVVDENKLYKRLQHKQEKALHKFEDRESELPQMISSHNNEVRSLREQLRRMREKYEKTDRYLKDAEDELEKANSQMKKYKALSEQKNLGERSELDRRLTNAELSLEEKQSRVKELERHLELVKKNHRQELRTEQVRIKKAQEEIQELKDAKANLETTVREKDKMLEAKNIYSNRFLKPFSHSGTPAESPSHWQQNQKKKSESMTDLTARDKARAYEDKRKAEEKKKLRLPTLPPSSHKSLEKPPRPQESKTKQEKEDEEKAVSNTIPDPTFTSNQREDSEADFWRRQEERYKQDQINRQKQEDERRRREEEEREQSRLREQQEKLQREREEREKAERERREADERERKEREQKEKDERERQEREQREREQREKEERERREAEEREKREQERKAKEEQERQAEERQKKDELLRRLQNMDTSHSDSQPSDDPFAPAASRNAESSPSKKDYTFTRSVENMHKGKPAREDVTVPYLDRQRRLKAANEDADIGGYQPSFSGPLKTTGDTQKKPLSLFHDSESKPAVKPAASGSDKKSKLMADLFGSQTVSNSSATKDESDDLFLGSKPPRQPAQSKKTSGFPWDDPAPTPKVNGTAQRESSALFGGGAALVEDDSVVARGGNTTLLPRRPRQAATTFSSKPAVMAVDNFDDDIEEVVL